MTLHKPSIRDAEVRFKDHEGVVQQGSLNDVLGDPKKGIKSINDAFAVALLALSNESDLEEK